MFSVYIILSCIAYITSGDRVVNTNTGPVQSVTITATVEAFLGIPYAEPPVGDLRFKRPSPKRPWSRVHAASGLPPVCEQVVANLYFEPNAENMTEDCLFLNLWVPYSSAEEEGLKPVMVFIHGGAFISGGTNMQLYNGTRLAEKGDVVVANMNYRLGSFGFLLLDEKESDDNMGIFDQIMAIKWIKANARAFGGDPDQITLFGESAGSIMISGYLSSPLTTDLFKRVILQSGTMTMPMTLDNNTLTLKTSRKLAETVGCAEDGNAEKILSCLQEIPARNLSVIEDEIRKTQRLSLLPRMGGDFLPQPLIHLLKEGDFRDT